MYRSARKIRCTSHIVCGRLKLIILLLLLLLLNKHAIDEQKIIK